MPIGGDDDRARPPLRARLRTRYRIEGSGNQEIAPTHVTTQTDPIVEAGQREVRSEAVSTAAGAETQAARSRSLLSLDFSDDNRLPMAKVSIWLHWLAAILALLLLLLPPTGAGLALRIIPLAAAALLFTVFLHRFPWSRYSERWFIVTSLLDLGLIGLGVAWSGGTESRYSLLFFLVVVFAAYFYRVFDTTLVTVCTLGAFLAPLLYTGHTQDWLTPIYASAAGVMVLVAAVIKQSVLRIEVEQLRRDELESERERMYEDEVRRRTSLQQKTRQLESILETGNAFRLQLGLDGLLEKIVSAIGQTAGFKAVVVRLFDPGSGAALCKAAYGIERHLVELPTPPELIDSLMDERFKVSRSYLVKLDPQTMEDPEKKPYLLVREHAEPGSMFDEWTPHHSLIVPLETRDHGLIGILSIDEPVGGRIPSLDTIQTLEIFANLAATAIDNARLLEEAGQAESLRELDRFKSEFLATVSHDLRTPLTVIKGSIDLLETHLDELPRTGQNLVHSIGRNTLRLMDMVEQLLEMIQLQEGRTILNRRKVNVVEIIRDTVEAMEVAASSRDQRIELGSQRPDFFIHADRPRLQQVLTNLIGNACKYGPEREVVTVWTEERDEAVCISVHDRGAPIAPEDRRRIFEKFFRSETMINRVGGSGLGLAICQSLIELHGGRIWLETPEEGGNTFRFTLPMPKGDA